MSFTDAIVSVLRQYVTFGGRASRAEYWWFALFSWLVAMASAVMDGVLGIPAAGTLTSLALVLPSLAVSVRRAHDSNLSGWWILVPVLAAAAGVVALVAGLVMAVGAGFAGDESGVHVAIGLLVLGGLLLTASVVVGLVVALRRSSEGSNRFGPSPHASVGYPPGGYAPSAGYAAPAADDTTLGYGPAAPGPWAGPVPGALGQPPMPPGDHGGPPSVSKSI